MKSKNSLRASKSNLLTKPDTSQPPDALPVILEEFTSSNQCSPCRCPKVDRPASLAIATKEAIHTRRGNFLCAVGTRCTVGRRCCADASTESWVSYMYRFWDGRPWRLLGYDCELYVVVHLRLLRVRIPSFISVNARENEEKKSDYAYYRWEQRLVPNSLLGLSLGVQGAGSIAVRPTVG